MYHFKSLKQNDMNLLFLNSMAMCSYRCSKCSGGQLTAGHFMAWRMSLVFSCVYTRLITIHWQLAHTSDSVTPIKLIQAEERTFTTTHINSPGLFVQRPLNDVATRRLWCASERLESYEVSLCYNDRLCH